MNKKNLFKTAVVILVSVLTSCSSYKEFTYLQDAADFDQMQVNQIAQVKARKGDILNIYVSSRNAESAIPFNLIASGYRPGSGQSDIFTSGTQRALGYQIDESGNIEFPQIGVMHVEGMSRTEIVEFIKDKLVSNNFLKDPIVTVEFQNLKITVLGEVNHSGNFSMTNEHTTLLDALAMAGDLTAYGRRDRVAVIREVDGKRTVMWHDLRSKNIFDSPRYYLQQNDIVYVQPNKYKASQSTQSRWNQPSVWISLVSTAISIVTLVKLLSNSK